MSELSIARTMYDYAERWPDKEIKHISPSMLGGCMRKHYYAMLGVPKTTPPGPGAQLNFELGRLWERPVTDALRYAGIPFIDQYKMYDEGLNVSGTLDFLLYYPKENTWEVLDSKTESVYSPGYRRREGKSFLESNTDYVYQVNAYALMALRQGFNVTKGRFVVITKDNGFIDEHSLTISKQSLAKTYARIKRLNGYLLQKKLPPCECKGWKVAYCNYGNPHTQVKNSKGKLVNSECCPASLIQEGGLSETIIS